MSKLMRFLAACGDSLRTTAVPAPMTRGAPRELHLELTYRCNTGCIMCNLRHLRSGAPELSCDELRGMVNDARSLAGVDFIVLSGGEAILRDDLVDIVAVMRRRFPAAGMLLLTNLYDNDLVHRRLDAIRERIGLDRFSVGTSLDGIGDAHDRMRGVPGSFAALAAGLHMLTRRYPGLFFSCNFTLTPENHDQALPAFLWARERGYHISFQVMVQKSETRQFTWTDRQRAVVEEHMAEIIRIIALEQGISDDNVFALLDKEWVLSQLLALHYIPRYLAEPRRYFPNCPCGEKFAMIDPAGNVYFCPVHKHRYAGNVRTDAFDTVWSSAAADEARRFFEERTCHCWLTCTNGHMIGTAIGDGKAQFLRSQVTAEGHE